MGMALVVRGGFEKRPYSGNFLRFDGVYMYRGYRQCLPTSVQGRLCDMLSTMKYLWLFVFLVHWDCRREFVRRFGRFR